jgi:NadR type nicotinamide-nucleotide adenylyltransferase
VEKTASSTAGLKKIVIIGPECTGKSRLSQKLAEHYDTLWVPEYAREYINRLDRPYNRSDLTAIAKGQVELEDRYVDNANGVLICDTNLIVIKVWSEHKYGQCDPWILEEIGKRAYDLYLLTYIDIPWEEDPQREHPNLRNYFYDVYNRELVNAKVRFSIVKGLGESRLQSAISVIDKVI